MKNENALYASVFVNIILTIVILALVLIFEKNEETMQLEAFKRGYMERVIDGYDNVTYKWK